MASVDQLRETIQGVKYANEGTVYEETWITTLYVFLPIFLLHLNVIQKQLLSQVYSYM